MAAAAPQDFGIEIEGLAKLLRALEKLDEAANDDLKEAALKAGQPVLEEARRLVPVRSGDLQSSIRLVKSARGVKIRAGNARVPYAMAVHFGHKRGDLNTRYRFRRADIKGNPFMFKAVDAKQDEVLEIYERLVIDIWNRNL